jgi:hypothetical protein
MTDIDLVKNSAIACGIIGNFSLQHNSILAFIDHPEYDRFWNPLVDDGQALRLAVRLHLRVDIHGCEVWVTNQNGYSSIQIAGNDLQSATRRAIVRAAAQIGINQSPQA